MIEQDSDYALLTEIAVAYYDQEQTQEEIAKRFGISRIKVGRLLKKARQEGIVEISVKYHPVFSSQIEQQFISHFGIKRALIALDHHDEDEQRQQVAALVRGVKKRYDRHRWSGAQCGRGGESRWRVS